MNNIKKIEMKVNKAVKTLITMFIKTLMEALLINIRIKKKT